MRPRGFKITDGERGETQIRFIDISDVALIGNVSITTPALAALLEREIPVTFHSHSGWFRGVAHGVGHRNVEIRTAQYRLSFDEAACLRFAKELVAAKIANQRTMLRRNWRGAPQERQAALDRLAAARKSADGAATPAQLLGIEGDAAAVYFRLNPANATAQGLVSQADAAIKAGDFTHAHDFLHQATQAQIAAAQEARKLRDQAQAATDAEMLGAASSTAAEGSVALTELRYKQAADLFKQAATLVPPGHSDKTASV